ncbi:MAG: putative Na+/H+ antiporter [Desulfobacteraceae bacterium]|nr:putative Na+/H+ antiporter [Desulfobacteraceae bacterium]MCB9494956.1 putative Na+/H+ antiporter [Desulfobacteraceae bacterium]
MNPTTIQVIGTAIFCIAVLHTFMVNPIVAYSHKFKDGSMANRLLHFLGEVEAVFGIWSIIFIVLYAWLEGFMVYDKAHHVIGGVIHYIDNVNYTEPAFVFVIMCMAGTRPILKFAETVIGFVAKLIPVGEKMAFYISAMIFGPLLGSFITEPAAMTVTALLLLKFYYSDGMSKKFKYATVGALFVNISVGGTLTHFAAPPVLMVAGKWGWGISHMITHFGYKAAIGVVIVTLTTALIFRKELTGTLPENNGERNDKTPFWLIGTHIVFIALVVLTAHHPKFFLGLFIFFLGMTHITHQYQDKLKLKESLLVGFFLAGLVTLGGMQGWWLQDLLAKLPDLALFYGATALTGVTDNAALTYLGSLVEGLSESAKYYLVAGAVTGGGLTVIANAPNPAGYGILNTQFEDGGINPLYLLISALFPTAVMLVCYEFLPSL